MIKHLKICYLLLFIFGIGISIVCNLDISNILTSQLSLKYILLNIIILSITFIGSLLFLPLWLGYLFFSSLLMGVVTAALVLSFGIVKSMPYLLCFLLLKLIILFLCHLNNFYYFKYLKNSFLLFKNKFRNIKNVHLYLKKQLIIYWLLLGFLIINYISTKYLFSF